MESEIIVLIIGLIVGVIIGVIIAARLYKQQVDSKINQALTQKELEFEKRIEDIKKSSRDGQRNSLKGNIGQQMAPLLPEFAEKFEPGDARFMGSPIDYVIFKNMSIFDKKKEENEPLEVVFVEIKSGKHARLEPIEEAVKDAIENKRVSFDTLKLNVESNQQNV